MDIFADCPCSGSNLPRFVQPVLLAMLAQEPQYGYEVARRLAESGLFRTPPDVTGIYRMLKSMEGNGVLHVSAEASGCGPARKLYAVTPLGSRCLARWQASLTAHQDHLERILRFLRRSPPIAVASVAPAGDIPPRDADFIRNVHRRVMAGSLPRREDILRLLSFAPDSPQMSFAGMLARDIARQAAGNEARVWGAIGVDCRPCAMNCAFCAFGARWGLVRESSELAMPELIGLVREFVAAGVSWIVLRTTEHYGIEHLRTLARTIHRELPPSCTLVANTAQLSTAHYALLKGAGITVVYHAMRLREGIDTPFPPTERRAAIGRIHAAGLELASLIEPVGAEHTDKEFADALLTALEACTSICGVMARVNVPGTPCAARPPVSDLRLAQLSAIVRLCCGTRTPWICVHPPVRQAVAWGANVLVSEAGAIPRDRLQAHGAWRGFSVGDALRMLEQCGYTTCAGQTRKNETNGLPPDSDSTRQER